MKKFIIFCLSVFLSILISSTAPIWADAKLSDIQNALGRTLDNFSLGADGTPVKTLFVFYDPACGYCKKLADSQWPKKFQERKARMIFIPVNFMKGSPAPGLYFLKHGVIKWKGQLLDDSSLPDRKIIQTNNKIAVSLSGGGKSISVPLLVVPVADGPGKGNYKVVRGLPGDDQFEKILNLIAPAAYVPYKGK